MGGVKSQIDLIIAIVALVIAMVVVFMCFGSKRVVPAAAKAAVINVAPAAIPDVQPVMNP